MLLTEGLALIVELLSRLSTSNRKCSISSRDLLMSSHIFWTFNTKHVNHSFCGSIGPLAALQW